LKTIDTVEALRVLYGHPGERAVAKEQAKLDEHTRAFIAASPFLVMGTSGADGSCDVSPKGDAPGFVHVLDDHHLAIPDRLGNNRVDGLSNMVENPHVALLFMIPGREDTLRVNGSASISRDEALLDRLAVSGKRPQTVLVVEVEQAFMHCTRAFKRAGLWDHTRWPDASSVPSMSRMIWDLLPTKPDGKTVEQYERESNERQKILY
jgi:PPOX class probable FMN-dependent enzyme